jgi:hypothetical protein
MENDFDLNLSGQGPNEEVAQEVGEPIAVNGLGQIDLNVPISMEVDSYEQAEGTTDDEVGQEITMEEEELVMPIPATPLQPVNFLHLEIEPDAFEAMLVSGTRNSNAEGLGTLQGLDQVDLLEGAAPNIENAKSIRQDQAHPTMLDLNTHQDDQGISIDLQMHQGVSQSQDDQSLSVIPYGQNSVVGHNLQIQQEEVQFQGISSGDGVQQGEQLSGPPN